MPLSGKIVVFPFIYAQDCSSFGVSRRDIESPYKESCLCFYT